MTPDITTLPTTKLVGISMTMSFQDDRTGLLWQKFMPRRGEINNRVRSDYFSMQLYGENWTFSPDDIFTKWAAVEVSSFSNIPSGMLSYVIQGGQYAVFINKGPAVKAEEIMLYIFTVWLPKSPYRLDHREHFEILPQSYDPMDENAEEEIWIPITR